MEGFRYAEEVLSTEEEIELVGLLDSETWSNALSRKTQQYGYEYNFYKKILVRKEEKIPNYLVEIAKKVGASKCDQIIVNEYLEKQYISSHTDNIALFGKQIIVLSLLDDSKMKFTKRGSESVFVDVKGKSIYILEGDCRYQWKHETIPMKRNERRISITFRSINSENFPIR